MIERQVKVIKIPAKGKQTIDGIEVNIQKKKVCAYVRVSSEEESQISSFDLQRQYYTDYINSKPDWEFAGVYSDYGKSGTSTERRDEFNKMIDDCKKGEIDLIISKSISRFARNTLDCLRYVRVLKNLNPPVGVYFEKEKLDTLDSKTELLLTILSSLAQEEARSTSENLKWGIRKRFESGKAMCPTNYLLGYDKDKNGDMIINEEEAKTVRRVYREYMNGKGAITIARELKLEGVPSARGGSNWGRNSIIHILKNERYCGDVLMQKHFTVDFLTHKKKENRGELPQYYIENHHPAIIPRDEWNKVQDEIKRRHELTLQEDRNLRMGYSNASVLSNRLFCGRCGQPLNKRMDTLKSGTKVASFRCRATFSKARKKAGYEQCFARRMREQYIKEAFMEMLIKLKESIDDIVNNEGNEALVGILKEINPKTEFEDKYFRELVERGTVHDDGTINYIFKSGLECTAYVKLDAKLTKRLQKSNKEILEGVS